MEGAHFSLPNPTPKGRGEGSGRGRQRGLTEEEPILQAVRRGALLHAIPSHACRATRRLLHCADALRRAPRAQGMATAHAPRSLHMLRPARRGCSQQYGQPRSVWRGRGGARQRRGAESRGECDRGRRDSLPVAWQGPWCQETWLVVPPSTPSLQQWW